MRTATKDVIYIFGFLPFLVVVLLKMTCTMSAQNYYMKQKTLINTLFFQSTCIQRAIDSHQVVKMTNGANIRFSTENALN